MLCYFSAEILEWPRPTIKNETIFFCWLWIELNYHKHFILLTRTTCSSLRLHPGNDWLYNQKENITSFVKILQQWFLWMYHYFECTHRNRTIGPCCPIGFLASLTNPSSSTSIIFSIIVYFVPPFHVEGKWLVLWRKNHSLPLLSSPARFCYV